MQLSEDQVAVFAHQLRDAFLESNAVMCRETLPEQCNNLADIDLKAAVAVSVQTAQSIGLSWQSNLATICLLDIRYKQSVLAEPEVKEHLSAATRPDIAFRQLFVGELAEVWTRLDGKDS